MVLIFANPDRMSTAYLPIFFDTAGPFAGDTGTPGVRPDGLNSRPAFTSTGGNAFLAWHANKSYSTLQIHPVANDFRVGGRFLFEAFPSTDPVPILGVVAFQGSCQCCVVVNPSGTLSIWRGVPGDTGADELKESTTALSLSQSYAIGFSGKVNRIAGMAEVWIGTSRFVTVPVGNTELQENFFWDGWLWGLVEDSAVNHIYGGDNYGHLLATGPDSRKIVASQHPSGTVLSGWTPNTASVHTAVGEASPDGDSTFVSGVNNGDRFAVDLSSVGDVPSPIYALQDTVLVKNTSNEEPVGIQFLNIDAAGVRTYPNGVIGVPVGDYLAFRRIYYQRQDDGEAITPSYADARKVGLELAIG